MSKASDKAKQEKEWCNPNSKDHCPICLECNKGVRPEDDRARIELTNLINSQRHAKQHGRYSGFLKAAEDEYKNRYGAPLS